MGSSFRPKRRSCEHRLPTIKPQHQIVEVTVTRMICRSNHNTPSALPREVTSRAWCDGVMVLWFHVRYWTKADKAGFWAGIVCPLMTQSGHLLISVNKS
jgi:hypothetical protein